MLGETKDRYIGKYVNQIYERKKRNDFRSL